MLTKEEIYNLYIIQNKSRNEMLEILGINLKKFKKLMKELQIKKSPKLVAKNIKKTCLRKYGVKSYTCTEEGKRYLSEKRKNRTKEEILECDKKLKQTCLERYGIERPSKLKSIQEKVKETNLKKYGGTGFASKEINEKIKLKIIEKYGVDNISKLEEIKRKKIETEKINNTINSSKDEEKIYFLLRKVFKEVKRQYISDLYPFHCDFYIPELNLYIEYQGYWTHGKISEKDILGPYNENNKRHQKILNEWNYKLHLGYKKYNSAIDTWVYKDPLKREIAKKNNLNWIEFFNMEQFLNWYNPLAK